MCWLGNVQVAIDDFFKSKGLTYWHELSILARLTEEVGEFAEAVNHFYGEKQAPIGSPIPSEEEEMGDILFTLICYANKHNVNLRECVVRSLDQLVGEIKEKEGASE